MTIVEVFGAVAGNTVRAKHIGRDIMAGLKNVVGGELKGYTELLQDARHGLGSAAWTSVSTFSIEKAWTGRGCSSTGTTCCPTN